ncbi:PAS domain S-box protein [Halochromatium glycolicum]|uniref:histidine kinase n=1 Tax=Halochromatium glycolicum TaxID=85075 RepID=A0AAJ0U2I9_9GAMM|nr:PAS domain S-box protein [Halochromatium glycolicum]MBK1704027.1 hypothetical protein [Halochromatium glycolicum]
MHQLSQPDDIPSGIAPLQSQLRSPRQRLLLLLVLASLAVLGYTVEIPLLFGVNIVLGSIAALLALMWLGPMTGLGIAAIGSSATWLFWGQPEAILPFVAELAVIGWLRHRARRRDPRPPPLAVLAALYWLVIGIPLVLVINGFVLGLDWPAAWLLSIKHALNGILNAAIAGLITLTVAGLRHGRHNITFGRILFNVLVLALLVPTLLFAGWQDRIIKQQLETEYALRAKLAGTSLIQALAERIRTDGIGEAERERALTGLDQTLRAQLPANWAPRLRLTAPTGSEAEGIGSRLTRTTEVDGLFVTRPAQPGPAPLRSWRQAVYQIRLPLPSLPNGEQTLTLSFSADPLIDELRRHTLVVLAVLLGLTLLGLAIAAQLSSWLTKPIRQLVQATQQLPTAIAGSHIPPRLPPMSVRETDELAKNMTGMAESLCASFEQLEQEKRRQGQQQAIAELQARLLSVLIAQETDEAAFADALCDEVKDLLPGYGCLLVRQTANEGLKPLGAAARQAEQADQADQARISLLSLLEQPGLVQSCREALRNGALQPLTLDAADLGTPGSAGRTPGFGLVLPIANDTAVLIAVEQHPGADGEPDRAFARQALEAAAGLAGVAFEALQLRHRHQVLIEALSQAQTGVVITERTDGGDDLISYVNSGFTAMTGYQPDEAIGRNCRFLQAEDRFQEARVELGTATQQGDACSVILRNYRKDGSLFWNSLHISPMRDRNGELTHYIAVQQDITEAIETLEQLRVSEAQLRDAEARYRLMIENVGDLIVRMDTDGRFEFVSPSYCQTFGKTEDELLGSAFMPQVHPDDRAATAAAMEALRSPPYRCTIEQRAQTIHGWRWFQWSNTAVLDDCAEIVGVIGVGRDITERKQAELALAEREVMVSELLALATGFVRVSDETLDATIDQALARVGQFVHADRAYLFRLDPEAVTVTNSHEWTAEGIDPMLERNLEVPVADLPMMMKALAAGEPLSIEQVAELDDDWATERQLLEGQQVQSLLLAPVRLEDELSGFVGIEATREPRQWSTVETHFLQLFANIFAASEQRSRSIAALKQSNDRYDALARQSRTIAWELDTHGRFTYISDVCSSVIGLPPDAILGRHYTSLIVEQEQPGRTARAADVLAEHQPFQDFVAPYRSSTGELVWLSTDGAPILSPSGQFIGYRGITKDVTDRQLTLKRLARSEARMSAIFNNAPIGIALIGHDRRPLMVNRAMVKLLGRSADTLVRMRFEEFTHPNDQQADIQAFDELLAGQRAAYRLTKRYLRADGEVIWCDLRVSLLPETPGGKAIPLAMIENTTELHAALERQRAAEQELVEYSGQLESLIDLVNASQTYAEQVQALLHLARRALSADASAIGLLGHDSEPESRYRLLFAVRADGNSSGPAEGPLPDVLLTEAEDQPGSPVIVSSPQEDRPEPSTETRVTTIGLMLENTTPDRVHERLLLTLQQSGAKPARTLEVAQRQLLRLVAQRIAAVRYQHQLQQNLVQLRERETIGHLASGVAHDFNNLLGVIDANLFFVAEGFSDTLCKDPEVEQVLVETRSALNQAKVITSGMLTMSRSGAAPLELTDLAALIGELQGILKQVLPPRIDLDVRVPGEPRAFTNRSFLQSALLNLALNARDAIREEGQLTLTTELVHWTGTGPLTVGKLPPVDCIEVRVTDNGSGIPARLLGQIFEPLFSTKAKNRGHGLGLFMVREFITRTQAGLIVESEPGEGSCFRILLPTQVPKPRQGSTSPAPEQMPAPPAAGTDARLNQRILLVEDDRRVRDALTRLLKTGGLTVETADHGQDALQRLATMEQPVDLVLSDIAMPAMDGLDLYACLTEQYPDLPVILMTGQQTHWEPPVSSRGEPAMILRKPIELETLQAAIREKTASARETASARGSS